MHRICAAELKMAGNFSKAIESAARAFELIKLSTTNYSPAVLFEYPLALTRAGNVQEALQAAQIIVDNAASDFFKQGHYHSDLTYATLLHHFLIQANDKLAALAEQLQQPAIVQQARSAAAFHRQAFNDADQPRAEQADAAMTSAEDEVDLLVYWDATADYAAAKARSQWTRFVCWSAWGLSAFALLVTGIVLAGGL
ncbi:hypothetical protein QCD60_28640 [Pokkaliibacter sp. MBI-7]|uniref:hypothetical protein n=1 Tax=Pokkaliibacter sp. MBI-7 TaxID=3040600 RepID=UPI002448688B|nr:hypothetical protein [Pokkaliibacter sp. MBI-7]MDH2436485.1 hypothetical protein [Pokkaliibacter sp. MBI-7]